MRVPKQYELTLNSETFAALKADFDHVLKNTLSNMQKKGQRFCGGQSESKNSLV